MFVLPLPETLLEISGFQGTELTAPTFATGIGLVLLGFDDERDYEDTRHEEAGETRRGAKKFLQKIKDFFEEEAEE